MLNMTDPEYVVCRSCGEWMAFGGYDVVCDNCGACDWAPADEFGNELSDEDIERLGIRTQEG